MSDFSDYSFVTSDVTATNGSVAVWDGSTGANLMILKGNKLSKNSMAVLQDTVVGCVNGKSLLEIWKLNNEGKKKIIPLPSPATAAEYTSKFNILACFLGSEVFLWQPHTGQLLGILRNVHSSLGSAILFLESSRIVTVDDSGLIALWDFENCECLWKCRPFGLKTVYACDIESKNALAVVAENGKMIVLSLIDGSPLTDMIDIGLKVHCILYFDDYVFFGCNNGIVMALYIHEMNITEIKVKNTNEMDHDITQLALTPDERGIIIVIDGLTAVYMSLANHQIERTKCIQFGSPLNCLRIVNKSADMFITTSSDSRILIDRLEFSPGSQDKFIVVKSYRRPEKEFFDSLIDCKFDYERLRKSKVDDETKRMALVKNVFNILNE